MVARVDVADLVRAPLCVGLHRLASQRLHGGATLPWRPAPVSVYVQQNQPPGVPPLELTGERTLPDVPAENYWYRRHLAVYEWIAARVGGGVVLDMACGEGYGSEVLARSAARGGRRRRQSRGARARPAALQRANLSFERGAVETFGEPGAFDAVVFLQTIEHVLDPPAVLAHFRRMLAPGGVAYVSTPNVLTLAPAGRRQVRQPLAPAGVPGRGVRASCAAARSRTVEMLGLFHARKLRVCTSWRSRSAGTRCTRASGSPTRSTTASRRRSRPATSRCGPSGSTARSTSWRSAGTTEPERLERATEPAHGLRHAG